MMIGWMGRTSIRVAKILSADYHSETNIQNLGSLYHNVWFAQFCFSMVELMPSGGYM